MGIITSTARAENIPKQVMQLARIMHATAVRYEHKCFVHSVPDQNVLFCRNLVTAQEFGTEFFVMNLDGAYSQVASNLMIVHWRTELVAVSVDPQSRILHQGQEEERFLVYRIVVSAKKGK